MWKAAQLAVQGEGHCTSGTPCQDKTYVLKAEDAIVVALADGAGSAKHSEIGAECVTQTVCRLLMENFDRYFETEYAASVATELLTKLQEELSLVASNGGYEFRDMASTLLAVAVKDERFMTMHIGDGVIGGLKGDRLLVMSLPDNGEFINVTTFVTSPDAISHLRLDKGELEDISAFILMSDGTAEGMYQRGTQSLIPAFERLIHATKIMPSVEVEEQLRENMRDTLCKVTMDDCSLILLVDGVESVLETVSSD